jgi:hypothetical protein
MSLNLLGAFFLKHDIYIMHIFVTYIKYIFSTPKLYTASPVIHESELFPRHSSHTALLTSVYHQNHNFKCALNTDIIVKFVDPIKHNSSINNAH